MCICGLDFEINDAGCHWYMYTRQWNQCSSLECFFRCCSKVNVSLKKSLPYEKHRPYLEVSWSEMGKSIYKMWILHKASESRCHPVFNLWFTLHSILLNKNRSIAVLLPCHGWENCSFHFLLIAFSEGVFHCLLPAVVLLVHRWDARVKQGITTNS